MRLTRFTDYSLRVLMYVAVAPGGRATISEVANAFGISENHLTKVVHLLGKEGFLSNTRGRGGGLALGAAARDIRLGDVVRLTEGHDTAAACFAKGDDCPVTSVCQLKFALGAAVDAFYQALGTYTLADVVENRKALSHILFDGRKPSTSRVEPRL